MSTSRQGFSLMAPCANCLIKASAVQALYPLQGPSTLLKCKVNKLGQRQGDGGGGGVEGKEGLQRMGNVCM